MTSEHVRHFAIKFKNNTVLDNECNKQPYAILATACVAPPVNPKVLRFDPKVRLNDYVLSLSRWLQSDNENLGDLVVLENSGIDPKEFCNKIINNIKDPLRNIEVISYCSPSRPDGLHYGYSEFQMIDDLMDSSHFLGDMFVKVTGRYYYANASKVIESLPQRINFACDSKNRPGIPLLALNPARSVDVGLFISNKSFYNSNIRKLYAIMENKNRFTHIEDIIFDKFLKFHGKDNIYLRFPVSCYPEGVGGNGDNLCSTKKKIQNSIKAFIRFAYPKLWI